MKLTQQQINALCNKIAKEEYKKRNVLLDNIKKSPNTKNEAKKIYKELNSLSKNAKSFVISTLSESYILQAYSNKLCQQVPYVNTQDIIDKIIILTIESKDLETLLKKLEIEDFKI